MALDARHRSSLYLKFVPLIGEDDANALMSEFPASEAEELVTKQFLRAELATLGGELGHVRSDLRSEIGLVRGEFRSEIGLVRGELRSELALLRTELAELENRVTVRLGAALGVTTAILATLITLQ